MEYLIGALMALGIGALATAVGFDRGRAFYPVVLVVIASYYVLFAIIGGSLSAMIVEAWVLCGFLAVSVAGFKRNLWLVVAALVGHAALDVVHPHVIENPGAPSWWPMFCLAFDLAAAGYLAMRLLPASRPAGRGDGTGGRESVRKAWPSARGLPSPGAGTCAQPDLHGRACSGARSHVALEPAAAGCARSIWPAPSDRRGSRQDGARPRSAWEYRRLKCQPLPHDANTARSCRADVSGSSPTSAGAAGGCLAGGGDVWGDRLERGSC